MNSVSTCPQCGKPLKEGVTRCWAAGCDYVVPAGSVATGGTGSSIESKQPVKKFYSLAACAERMTPDWLASHHAIRQSAIKKALLVGACVFLVTTYVAALGLYSVLPTGYPGWAKTFLAFVAGGMVAAIVGRLVHNSGVTKSPGYADLNDADKIAIRALTNSGIDGQYPLTMALCGFPLMLGALFACFAFLLTAMGTGPHDSPETFAAMKRWAMIAQALVFVVSIGMALVLIPRTLPWAAIQVSPSKKLFYKFLSGAAYVFFLNVLPWIIMFVGFIAFMMVLEQVEKNQGPFNVAPPLMAVAALGILAGTFLAFSSLFDMHMWHSRTLLAAADHWVIPLANNPFMEKPFSRLPKALETPFPRAGTVEKDRELPDLLLWDGNCIQFGAAAKACGQDENCRRLIAAAQPEARELLRTLLLIARHAQGRTTDFEQMPETDPNQPGN